MKKRSGGPITSSISGPGRARVRRNRSAREINDIVSAEEFFNRRLSFWPQREFRSKTARQTATPQPIRRLANNGGATGEQLERYYSFFPTRLFDFVTGVSGSVNPLWWTTSAARAVSAFL